ncbi:MAG TPA: hypothetical protein VK419_12355 [Bryobacteraceae bacterium]|nr:hypothetical protein [Bryobacteraceae bacterium]
MNRRFSAAMLIGIAALASVRAVPQSLPKPSARTPAGQPDLQGTWNNVTVTPLERPRDLADKAFFTAEEQAAYEQRMVARHAESADARDTVADPAIWWEQGTNVVKTRRTSLVTDPPDGRIPALTPEARKRMADQRAETRQHPADSAQNRSLQERCLLSATTGPPMLPGPYNNNIEIVQTPEYVMMTIEMIHDVRIIPLDGRPHLDSSVRQWLGDSRGHWENDTLVVDTTNFTDKTHFRGSDENLHLIERFTRVDAETLLYQFTVDDPTAFTKPWTAELPMTQSHEMMYEFACHEGNFALEHMLSIAREEEKVAASQVVK